MKNNKSKHPYRQWIILSFILIFLWFIIIHLIIIKNENKKRSYLDSEIKSFTSKITSILGSYDNFSNYIFYESKHKNAAFSIINEAYTANKDRKKELAVNLKKLLKEEYEKIESYGFDQIDFLFPDGEIFATLQPKNDKNIFENYEKAEISNVHKTFMKSFEENNFYDSYRYVYIMTYENKYIGIAEISMPLADLMKIFSNFYPDINIDYLIKNSILSPVSASETQNKSGKEIYIFDNYVNYFSIKNNKNLKDGKETLYFEKVRKKIQKHIKSDKSFGIFSDFENKKYINLFIPVKGKKNKTIGYLMITSENLQYDKFSDDLYVEIIFISLSIIISLMGAFIFVKDKNKFRELSGSDYLTKLYNRSKFMEFSNYELKKCAKNNSSFSILLIDIDYFKKINDNYGHNTGDEVLRIISYLLKNSLRKTDIIARWGGEEFICLLPDTDFQNAFLIGEKLRKIVETIKFEENGSVTISIGIHEKSNLDFTIESINKKADIALYYAKQNGRNKTIVYKDLYSV